MLGSGHVTWHVNQSTVILSAKPLSSKIHYSAEPVHTAKPLRTIVTL